MKQRSFFERMMHSLVRTPRVLRAGGGGLLRRIRTLLQWDPEAEGGVHNPDSLRAQVWYAVRSVTKLFKYGSNNNFKQ